MDTNAKKILKMVVLSLFLIFIMIFVFFRSKDLIFGVKIRNVNIVDGAKVENEVLKITGNAKNAIELRLNDRIISIDQSGNFDAYGLHGRAHANAGGSPRDFQECDLSG